MSYRNIFDLNKWRFNDTNEMNVVGVIHNTDKHTVDFTVACRSALISNNMEFTHKDYGQFDYTIASIVPLNDIFMMTISVDIEVLIKTQLHIDGEISVPDNLVSSIEFIIVINCPSTDIDETECDVPVENTIETKTSITDTPKSFDDKLSIREICMENKNNIKLGRIMTKQGLYMDIWYDIEDHEIIMNCIQNGYALNYYYENSKSIYDSLLAKSFIDTKLTMRPHYLLNDCRRAITYKLTQLGCKTIREWMIKYPDYVVKN